MLSFFAPPALVECGYTIPAAQLFCEAVGAWFALMFLVVVARNPFPTKNQFIVRPVEALFLSIVDGYPSLDS